MTGSHSIKSSSGAAPAEQCRSYVLRGSIWRKPPIFPKIGPAQLFLAQAVWEIGERRFGWEGDEVYVTNGDAASPASQRLFSALTVLSDAGRAGYIPALLWRRGCKVRAASVDIWYGADPLPIFSDCLCGPDWERWMIFVDRVAVDRIATVGAPEPASAYNVEQGGVSLPPADDGLPTPSKGKGLAMLRAFHKRLKNGETLPTKAAEYRAICEAWPDNRDQPSEDTWRRSGGPYWDRVTWPGNEPSLDPQIIAKLSNITGI